MGVQTWVRRSIPQGRQNTSDSAWSVLQARVRECRKCELHKSRHQTVFGVGPQSVQCLIVGEAPGAEEDRQGEPFVGRAGKLLNAMLKAINLDREAVYIANILKCRPPGNRDPRVEEIQSCEPYLLEQIELLEPQVILAMGRIAAQSLLRTSDSIGKLRGARHVYGPTNVPMVVTYHPAYLLRSPEQKAKTWDDLKFLRSILQG